MNLSSDTNNSGVTFKLTGLTRKPYTTLTLAQKREKKENQFQMMENASTYLELAEV